MTNSWGRGMHPKTELTVLGGVLGGPDLSLTPWEKLSCLGIDCLAYLEGARGNSEEKDGASRSCPGCSLAFLNCSVSVQS